MNEDAGRKVLARLLEHLRGQQLPFPLSAQKKPRKERHASDQRRNLPDERWDGPPPWARPAIAALEKYLSGTAPSLDAAFGLKRGKGRPANPKRRESLVRKAMQMRREGHTWLKVAEALGVDERDIRRNVRDLKPRLRIEAVAADVARALTNCPARLERIARRRA